jgi:riboflavin biosynthesis pyrimidine reductase
VQQLHPAAADLDEDGLEQLYAPPPGPWTRLGMVSSLDGGAALGGLSAGLSGDADRYVFALLRSRCDVVLVGAGTARAEGYRPARVSEPRQQARTARGQRPTPLVAVVSRGGGLPAGSPLLAPGAGTLLLTTEAGAREAPPGLEPVVTGTDRVDLAAGLAALRARGLDQVLCEGGPSLAGDLAAAGLLDELCLTTSPVLAGGDGPRLLRTAEELGRPARLASLVHGDGALLARWVIAEAARP